MSMVLPTHPIESRRSGNADVLALGFQCFVSTMGDTCATLMHLQGVPIVVIAAWLGHVDAGFTMRIYAHAQPGSLFEAAQSFARHVTSRDNWRTV